MNDNLNLSIVRKNIARHSVSQRCEYGECANKACCASFRGNSVIFLCVIHGGMAEKDPTEKVVWAKNV